MPVFQAILAIQLMLLLHFTLATLILSKVQTGHMWTHLYPRFNPAAMQTLGVEKECVCGGGQPMQSAEQGVGVWWVWWVWERKDEAEKLQHQLVFTGTDGNIFYYSDDLPQVLWNEKHNSSFELDGSQALAFEENFCQAESNHARFGVLSVAMTAIVAAELAETNHNMPCAASLTTQNSALSGMYDLTRIVVTISVLFASVSETLISRLVEFIAKVLLEYQIPI